ALDVYSEEPLPREHPLRKMENTILTPHIGGSTVEAQKKIARVLAMKIVKTLEKLGENGLKK
ncbi:MAG: NAD(P)-dependent oxidoreductase, partial [Candidatus Bathyarchaeia archaeon]